MKGISTKVTSSTLAIAVLTIAAWLAFTAPFGPQWDAFPPEVEGAFEILAVFAAGFLVRETAEAPVEPIVEVPEV